MATNEELVQQDLQKCNITMWEPDDLSEVQLSACRLGCLSEELTALQQRLTDAANALDEIENIATADDGYPDVRFEITTTANNKIVWDMAPTLSGLIAFSINPNSKFFKSFLVPNVSTLLVPTTEDDGSGGTVDRPSDVVQRERETVLRTRPKDTVETTITAVQQLKSIVDNKKAQLEATAS